MLFIVCFNFYANVYIKLLLFLFHVTADKAIAEMNTKPKKITAAYSKALKYAHKPESRIRLVLIGDSGSG